MQIFHVGLDSGLGIVGSGNTMFSEGELSGWMRGSPWYEHNCFCIYSCIFSLCRLLFLPLATAIQLCQNKQMHYTAEGTVCAYFVYFCSGAVFHCLHPFVPVKGNLNYILDNLCMLLCSLKGQFTQIGTDCDTDSPWAPMPMGVGR